MLGLLVGVLMPTVLLVCCFYFLVHKAILAPADVPDEFRAEFEPARVEIRGESTESRFWRMALGYSAWRAPRLTLPLSAVVDIKVRRHQERLKQQRQAAGNSSQLTTISTSLLSDLEAMQQDMVLAAPDDAATVAAIARSQLLFAVCLPMFSKQRGVLRGKTPPGIHLLLARVSCRSMINGILLTGFMGACRGYALSDPCTRSEGSLIFMLILALIGLFDTVAQAAVMAAQSAMTV